MPFTAETSLTSHIFKRVALLALAVMACAGLAGCGGGGSGSAPLGGDEVTIVPQTAPDLLLESPSVSEARPAAGSRFTLSVTVRNTGDGDAAATTLRFFLSRDAAITASDTQVDADAVEKLAASGSVAVPVELRAPSTSGVYYYGACVDAVEGESDTVNNCLSAVRVEVPKAQTPASEPQPLAPEVRVVRPGPQTPVSREPDLVVKSFYVSNARPAAGAKFRASATVRNVGGQGVARARAGFHLSTDATITRLDAAEPYKAVGWLPPLHDYFLWKFLTAPSTPGTYYYGACVGVMVGESDKTNNCSESVKVTVRAGSPDLVVGPARVSDANPAAGGAFLLGVNVRNAGDGPTPKTTVRVYRSDDATFTTSDPQVNSFKIPKIDPPGHDRANHLDWRLFVRSPSSKGDYYYRACADTVAGESDTTNNCSASVKIEVTHAKPNLQVLRSSWKSQVGAGNSFWLNARVRNVGGPSAATTLRFHLLPDKESSPSSDTEIATAAVPALTTQPEDTEPAQVFKSLNPTAPSTPGKYYYIACADALTDESDKTDNCSQAFDVDVR